MLNDRPSPVSVPHTLAVIGGGPAGLTAAYTLQRRAPEAWRAKVFEGGEIVGGIARTESHNGFRFDIGGHRFFTKVPEVEALWFEIMDDDMIVVERRSRIYYRGRYYDYPLKLFNALGNIGPVEAARVMASYAKWRLFPHKAEDNFESWVINRFGGRLYMHFFRSYTQKVWGIPPRQIRADWAAQRIKNLSLFKAVWNAISGANDTASLIERFHYPRLGPGQMWERCAEKIEGQGGSVETHAWVGRVNREGERVTSFEVHREGAPVETVEADQFVNTMPLAELVEAFDPPAPTPIRAAAAKLAYRDFLIVTLVLDHADPFPDNWIYIHSPDVAVGRIQNFRAWSVDMVPDPDKASIGMEYFCNEGDALWEMEDEALRDLAARELEALNLAAATSVVDFCIIRQKKAYPVYDEHYKEAVDTIAGWIDGLANLQTVGRNGLHRYNNQDHSMLTGMLAAENILGETHDLWSVNVERSYHEEMQVLREGEQAGAEKLGSGSVAA